MMKRFYKAQNGKVEISFKAIVANCKTIGDIQKLETDLIELEGGKTE